MPGGSKKNVNAALILALAGGASVPAAAAKAGCSPQTAYRRMAKPDFCAQVAKLRAEMVQRAAGHLAAGSTQAARALRKLLKDADPKVRLGAAKAILACEQSLRMANEVAADVAAIKEQLDKQKNQPKFSNSE